jgi:hypothetical protein
MVALTVFDELQVIIIAGNKDYILSRRITRFRRITSTWYIRKQVLFQFKEIQVQVQVQVITVSENKFIFGCSFRNKSITVRYLVQQ